MPRGEVVLDNNAWVVGEPLVADRAGFGEVFHAVGPSGEDVVAKYVRKEPGAEREMLIGDSLRAAELPNVVPILDYGEDGDYWVLIMPRADVSLAQHLAGQGALPVKEIVEILSDVAAALAGLEGEIVHRDLKPANVLRLDGTWCVADFGIARYADASTAVETRKYAMTAPYAAPEQWEHQRATAATDVYAFGVMAYEMLAGHLPFQGPDFESFRRQHLEESPPQLTNGTARLRAIVRECLLKAPQARPTPANLADRLQAAAVEPALTGLRKLAEVNEQEVQRRSDEQAAERARASAEGRRERLFTASAEIFESFSQPLLEAIEDDAPTATVERGAGRGEMLFVAQLSGARLGLSRPRAAGTWSGPFEVVSEATIAVNLGTENALGWKGRAHSLWYCDAKEKGRFAWYETAFMASPFQAGHPSVEPYSNSPGSAAEAFMGVIGTAQVAWPVQELSPDDPSEFLDRWLGWFADAAMGRLARPSTMPERSPQGSWRRQ
jgi:serine/threonine-protein kinase